MKRSFQIFQRNKICGIFIDDGILSSPSLSLVSTSTPTTSSIDTSEIEDAGEGTSHISGLTLVTGKYSSKLKKKNFSLFEIALNKHSKYNDGSLLRTAKDFINQNNENIKRNHEINKILNYLEARGLISLLSINSINESDEYHEELAQFLVPMKKIEIIKRVNEVENDEIFMKIQNKFEIFPTYQTLLISSRDNIINYGNENNYLTARFRSASFSSSSSFYFHFTLHRSQTRSGLNRSNYTIEEVSQIRDIIEDINGISYRS